MEKSEIINSILSLPADVRMEIIDKVYESFDSEDSNEIEALWAEEADRRVEAILNGEMKTIPAVEVYEKINKLR